jgi:hypothetical protein
VGANAVELTAEQAWFVADSQGVGHFPWVLAITPPYADQALRPAFDARMRDELSQLRVLTERGVLPEVVGWIRTVCRARRWLELRFVSGRGNLLRGIVARCGDQIVVALRSGALVTFTEVDVDHPQALVPVLTVGLSGRPPARFGGFTLAAGVGAKADTRLRDGAALDDVMDQLGIPPGARDVVAAAFEPDRRYVEIVAGEHRDGHRVSTGVGMSVVDTAAGRVLVSPTRAFDGEWISTFEPGTPLAIATALERLTETLPDGPWFPEARLTRDFDQRTEDQECPTPSRRA